MSGLAAQERQQCAIESVDLSYFVSNNNERNMDVKAVIPLSLYKKHQTVILKTERERR